MCFKTLGVMKFVSLTVSLFISNVSSPSGPSLKDLQSKKCPEHRPTLCIPYGACCNHSEFCYAGICESCFPEEAIKSDLLKWCREHGRHNVSFMRDSSCRFACQNKFTAHELTVFNNTIVFDERYEKAKDLQVEHKVYTPDAFGLTAFILVILLMLGIIIYIKGKCLIQKLKIKTMPREMSKTTTSVETDLGYRSSKEIDCNDNKTKSHLKLEDPTEDVEKKLHGQEKNTFTKTENVDNIQSTNVIQPKGNARHECDLHRPQININKCKQCLNSNLTEMDVHNDDCKQNMNTDRDLIKKLPKGTIEQNDREGEYVVHVPNEKSTKTDESFTTKKKKRRAYETCITFEEIKPLMNISQRDDASHLQNPSMSSFNAVSPTEEKCFVDSLNDSSKGFYEGIDVLLKDKSSAKESFQLFQSDKSNPPATGIDTLTEGPDNKVDGESNLSQALQK